jgi:hypothetical protein
MVLMRDLLLCSIFGYSAGSVTVIPSDLTIPSPYQLLSKPATSAHNLFASISHTNGTTFRGSSYTQFNQSHAFYATQDRFVLSNPEAHALWQTLANFATYLTISS